MFKKDTPIARYLFLCLNMEKARFFAFRVNRVNRVKIGYDPCQNLKKHQFRVSDVAVFHILAEKGHFHPCQTLYKMNKIFYGALHLNSPFYRIFCATKTPISGTTPVKGKMHFG